MPISTIVPDAEGNIRIGSAVLTMAALEAMATPANLNDNVSGSGVKLEEGRVRVLAKVADVEGEPMRGFTIAFSVQREPATEGEKVAIDAKKGAGEARKAKIASDADAERQRLIAAKDAEAARRIADVKEMAVAGNEQTSRALGSAFAAILQTGGK